MIDTLLLCHCERVGQSSSTQRVVVVVGLASNLAPGNEEISSLLKTEKSNDKKPIVFHVNAAFGFPSRRDHQ